MSNSNEQHTPTPWKVDRFDHLIVSNDPDAVICGVRGQHVTDFVKPADAYLIVRAVNAHDELLAACKAWVDYFDALTRNDEPGDELAKIRNDFHRARIEATRAAIAKATGEPSPLRDDERAEVLKSAAPT
jgi:hypothetical protein